VQLVRTRDEARSGSAGAFALERRRDRTGDPLITGEAEVIVRREVDGRSPLGGHSSTATCAHGMRLTPEIRVIEHGEIAAEHGIERRRRRRSRMRSHGAETTRLDDARSSVCGALY